MMRRGQLLHPNLRARSSRPANAKSSGIVVPHAPRWHQRLGAWLVFALVRVVSATLRYRWSDRSGYFEDGSAGPAIYCVWHNRLALCMVMYYGYVKKRNQHPRHGRAGQRQQRRRHFSPPSSNASACIRCVAPPAAAARKPCWN